MHDRDRARPAEAQLSVRAIWQGRVDPATFEPLMDHIEDRLEPRRNQPAEQSRPGRETPVGPNQMLASRRHFRPILALLRRDKPPNLTFPSRCGERFTVNRRVTANPHL